jgi:hypothetical protein
MINRFCGAVGFWLSKSPGSESSLPQLAITKERRISRAKESLFIFKQFDAKNRK